MDEAALSRVREALRGGELVIPGDDAYDAARSVWNGMVDRRPALVACCSGAADVVEAIRLAGEQELIVSRAGRRSQRRRLLDVRRRGRHRSLWHARGNRRSAGPEGAGRRRRSRRRLGSPPTQGRAHDRQPSCRWRWSRRRGGSFEQASTGTRTCCGVSGEPVLKLVAKRN